MPVELLQAFSTMLPRLRARRSLEAIRNHRLAEGLIEKRDAERLERDLRRIAEGGKARAERPGSPGQLERLAGAAGIGMRRVPAASRAAGGDSTGAEDENASKESEGRTEPLRGADG